MSTSYRTMCLISTHSVNGVLSSPMPNSSPRTTASMYAAGLSKRCRSRSTMLSTPTTSWPATVPILSVFTKCSSARLSRASLGIPTVSTAYTASSRNYGPCTGPATSALLMIASLQPRISRPSTSLSRKFPAISNRSRSIPRFRLS